MAKPSFINLWKAYQDILEAHPAGDPCDGGWDNQCAIRMSIALNGERSIRINKSTYSEPKCAHDHARGAESLANWLWKHHLGRPTILTGSVADRKKLAQKTGIIFFKDCFARGGESFEQRSGDHIDVWSRGSTQTYDDPAHRSKQVWFWELS
ncbi:putative uncharacterized protein [Pseudomonas sp. StFLB209]|uniref:type VI secretion system amidase effector protein Tae4 n=1 Tax=Pseudomonas sp. StFLB209 TaxID=1028989 RepID=UPI0004F64DA6|nr:type VI secretion system amidase effector protein Tae4 [Pseudomonas sp. StFLB209]BAP42605.1 putative uncharacterized protein [Pseudomonas sp. StFLB209]